MAVNERELTHSPSIGLGDRALGSWSRQPPLVGRAAELAALCSRLLDPTVGLVTIVGPGGCGKTRLARAAAAQLFAEFPHGIVLIDLAPLWNAADVLPAIAYALGVQDVPKKPVGFAIADHLTGRQTLLVLDNFEHLLGAAADLAAVLEDAPGTTCMATSRTALNLYGEQEFPLGPLALPTSDAGFSAASVTDGAAVQLFVRAAQLVRPDFALSDANAAVIAEICTRLDGLPLALELAAARLKVLTPEALLRRLTDGATSPMELLSTGAPNVPARHQTMRGAIAWSYALLVPPEQALFRRLSVFAGGASLDAITDICLDKYVESERIDEPLDRITALVNQSLIRQTEAAGEPRFEMLTTIREFALEQLVDSEAPAVLRERHAQHYLHLAESIEPAWDRQASDDAGDQVEREYDNLRAALSWSVDEGRGGDTGLRLAGALWWFWKHRGRLSEGRSWLAAALESGPTTATSARAKALFAAGVLAAAVHDDAAAAALIEESAANARDIGELELLAQSLNKLACVTGSRDGQPLDREPYLECLAIWRAAGNQTGVAKALNGLGEAAREQGDFVEARRYYEEALTLVDQETSHIARTLQHNLAYVAGHDGETARMAELFRRALERSVDAVDDATAALCIAGLAGAAAATGSPERAARLFGAAATLRSRNGVRMDMADRIAYEDVLSEARAALPEETFDLLWQEGESLTFDEMLAEAALVDGVRAVAIDLDSPPRARGNAGLTRRECEVAVLVAQGLTNRQIAESLTIAERTVGTHVEHIMAKLDCHSRAQIAAWMAEHGLLSFPNSDPLQVA